MEKGHRKIARHVDDTHVYESHTYSFLRIFFSLENRNSIETSLAAPSLVAVLLGCSNFNDITLCIAHGIGFYNKLTVSSSQF